MSSQPSGPCYAKEMWITGQHSVAETGWSIVWSLCFTPTCFQAGSAHQATFVNRTWRGPPTHLDLARCGRDVFAPANGLLWERNLTDSESDFTMVVHLRRFADEIWMVMLGTKGLFAR